MAKKCAAVKYPNVKAELARLNLNTGDLAEFMGMSRQNLDNKLKGRYNLYERDMKAIQDFFIKKGGTYTLDYLFTSISDLGGN